jgi:hypothetical protein
VLHPDLLPPSSQFPRRRPLVLTASVTLVHWYQMERVSLVVERVQTGVRLEKRLLKVLKGLAEYHDLTLGDLLEGIVLHAFDGKCAFGPESLACIRDLKRLYGLNLDSHDSHRLVESGDRMGESEHRLVESGDRLVESNAARRAKRKRR